MRKRLFPLLAVVGALLALAHPLWAGSSWADPVDDGSPRELYRRALMLERGNDTLAADTAAALALYRQAASAGYRPAMSYLGYSLLASPGPEARSEGLRWTERAAIEGDERAASNLGFLLMEGRGVERNDTLARYWLTVASRAGLPMATSMLGDLVRDGRGAPADSLLADSLYSDAFGRGLRDAGYKLASLRHDLNPDSLRLASIPADSLTRRALLYYTHALPDVALPLLRNAAGRGNPRAMTLLGDASSRAYGTTYDNAAALGWFARAAMAGDPPAQFIVAETLEILPQAFDDISGFPSDIPTYWYELARHGGVQSARDATLRMIGTE